MKLTIMDGHAVNPGDLSWSAFDALADVTVYERTAPADVVLRAKDADCVFTNKVIFDKDVLTLLPKLKYIGVLATGTNVIDLHAATERGIVVTNIPAYSTDSVVQLVFAHILNVVNRVGRYADDTRHGRWSGNADFCYWDAPFHELTALTLGIVGLGNIGRRVAEIAHAFGMKINAATSKTKEQLPEYINKLQLPDLFASSDIVTLHCPLTPDTKEIINCESLSLFRRGAILINTGRGPLVDETAAAEALSTGQLSAYCADVMCEEPPQLSNPLLSCPNAFITPHLAWGTVEARRRLMDIAYANLSAFLAGNAINTVI
ncbi:MAG: D-2-hydroxyacid dehydrogenase [Prevotella sp.]|nr:D-2-hydroxyacid dehydrogenase [Prevotella sp.]